MDPMVFCTAREFEIFLYFLADLCERHRHGKPKDGDLIGGNAHAVDIAAFEGGVEGLMKEEQRFANVLDPIIHKSGGHEISGALARGSAILLQQVDRKLAETVGLL